MRKTQMNTSRNLANTQCGWASNFPRFSAANLDEIVNSLTALVQTSTPQQIEAWKGSVPPLQKQCAAFTDLRPETSTYSAVLEYQLPNSMKRADAILLVSVADKIQDRLERNENTNVEVEALRVLRQKILESAPSNMAGSLRMIFHL
jgi:hypothetical protein